jgi:hypothetical protein
MEGHAGAHLNSMTVNRKDGQSLSQSLFAQSDPSGAETRHRSVLSKGVVFQNHPDDITSCRPSAHHPGKPTFWSLFGAERSRGSRARLGSR